VRLSTTEAREAVFRAMHLPSVPARKAAATALAAFRTPAALRALQQGAEHDSDERVRQICLVLVSQ
jgi:hypothetical protein